MLSKYNVPRFMPRVTSTPKDLSKKRTGGKKRAAFGIFTPARSTRKAINSYLDGFLVEENVRIRDKPISFVRGSIRAEEIGLPILEWGNIEKKLGDFKLTTGEGKLHEAEVVGVVGPNATGTA